MKKVLQTSAKYIFAAFGVAVLMLLMSLTYSALARIFPENMVNRIWGLVMFDIAAMAWAIAFVFASNSAGQYATAGIGFIVGFVGTLGMVAAEVSLSSGMIEPGEIGDWMVYGFIIVTALHAGLIYANHATAPEINEKINVGMARGEIVTQAITQATKQLEEEKADLARSIHADIVSEVKRELGLIPVDGTPFEIREAQSQGGKELPQAGDSFRGEEKSVHGKAETDDIEDL